MSRTMTAAVLWESGSDWTLEEVSLDPPKTGEVLVRYEASGLCHSDDHIRTGDMPMATPPLIGGHEGAGIVEEVGPGVTDFSPGDHFVTAFIPSCGRCRWCASGRQNLCDWGATLMLGRMADGTSRVHAGGRDFSIQARVGTFAPWNVVSTQSLIKIDADLPLDRACMLGCGVTTGWGAAVYSAKVRPGDTVVVVGCGGIGTSAIQGARAAGAEHVVAVDIAARKEPLVRQLGATEFVTDMEQALDTVADLTRGVLADAVILTVGVLQPSHVTEGLRMVRKDGKLVVVAVAPHDVTTTEIPWQEVTLFQKQIVGSLFGSANPWADVPRLLSLYRAGDLKLDEMVTEYKLSDINMAYRDMHGGRHIRGVIRHQH